MPARIYTLPLATPEIETEPPPAGLKAVGNERLADVIELQSRQQERRLHQVMESLAAKLESAELPSPAEFGWVAVDHVEGRPIQWMNAEYGALIGYVPGATDLVYLDRNHRCCSWAMSLEELALGLEFGTLPEPLHEVVL